MDRIISNCEQCVNFSEKWDFRRDCKLMKREIMNRGGIPDWCPWPPAEPKEGA